MLRIVEKNDEFLKKGIVYVIYILIASAYILLLSYSTSFVFPRYWGSDSAIFQTIGMGWSKGALPYVDLFDHKGPIIFLIDMLGYKISGTSTGVLCIQIVSFVCFMVLTHCICKESGMCDTKAFFCTILNIMFLSFSYDEGNMTEEYMLPYIALTFWLGIKYLKKYNRGNMEHPVQYAFWYGVSFAFGLMTRLTNALPVIVFVVSVTILLILHKKWKNLLKNIGAFLIGVALVVLPFAIYFYVKGAFSDLVWGTIGYNLFYTNKNAVLVMDLSDRTTRRYLFSALVPIVGILLTGIQKLASKKYAYALVYGMLGLAELLLFLNISFYPHYTMILVPNIALILFELAYDVDFSKYERGIYYVGIVVCCLISTKLAYENIKWMYQRTHNYEPEYVQYLQENKVNDSVITYNTDNKCLYLDYDIVPQYRYFALQDWQGDFSEVIATDIYDIYESASVEYLIVKGKETIIDDVLKSKYHIVNTYEEQDVAIWRLNDQ